MVIHFTSDTHFGHFNIIRSCNRPFTSSEEMDEVLIANWNAQVGVSDVVYHLGDFSWTAAGKYRKRLNGNIHLICGNHDQKKLSAAERSVFGSCRELAELKIGDKHIVLCHYAMRVWNKSHFNSWHLYGHSHGNLPGQGKSFDVGVDAWGLKPISLEQVIEEMAKRPDNLNLIR